MIKVAIIGAGIGKEHLDAYRKLPELYKVSTMCDLDTARAAQATDNDASINIVSSIATVLADPKIDLVDVCLPPQLHVSQTLLALESGKHVVCEKPIARSLSETEHLRSTMEQSERRIFPVFQYRYGLGFTQLKALIKQGLAGRALIASAETHWNRQSDYYAVPWRGTWKHEMGGAILSHAIHAHDLLCHFFGPVSTVTALTDTLVNDIETEDCAAISMRMQNGALATSSVSLGAASDTSRFRFVFQGLTAQSGSAPYTPAEDTWTFSARGTTNQAQIDQVLQSVETPQAGFVGFFEAVANTLSGQQGANEVSFADGQRSIELVTAIYLSAKQSGMPVNLPINKGNALFNGWMPD